MSTLSVMRFRRRSDAPSEPEPDDSAWARPPGDDHSEDAEPHDPSPPPPPEWETVPEVAEEDFRPEAAPVEEPAHAAAEESPSAPVEEPAYAPVEELPYEPAEELPYEQAEESAYAVVEGRAYEPAGEPLPEEPEPAVSEPPAKRWPGGRDTMGPSAEGTVRAAGGVVWSRWQGGLRVVVVHRPRYDDWSLPKGKAGPGESDAECALREVREETGLACSLGEGLGTTTYYDRHGRLKTVVYYAMQPLGGGEGPQAEVDEVRWLGLEEAKRLLSYERDVEMLDALAAMAAMAARRDEPEEPPAG